MNRMLEAKVLVGDEVIGAAQIDIELNNRIWCKAIRIKKDKIRKISTIDYLLTKAQTTPLQFECDNFILVNAWLVNMNNCYATEDLIIAQDLTFEYEDDKTIIKSRIRTHCDNIYDDCFQDYDCKCLCKICSTTRAKEVK